MKKIITADVTRLPQVPLLSSCPITTNGSISRRVAPQIFPSDRCTSPLFPIPAPSSRPRPNRGEAAAAPCLLSFPPLRPYPPSRAMPRLLALLSESDHTFPPSLLASLPATPEPDGPPPPPLPARVGTTTFSLVPLPIAISTSRRERKGASLLAAKDAVPSSRVARCACAVSPLAGHVHPMR